MNQIKLSLTSLMLLAVAGVLMACGPSSQYNENQNSLNDTRVAGQEPDCPYTEGNYPILDDTLQDAVRKYETCELTEEQAAAKAPLHHGTSALTRIEFSDSADVDNDVAAAESWMDSNGVTARYKAALSVNWVYAYVPVSRLGPLSQQEGIGKVGQVLEADEIPAPTSSGTSTWDTGGTTAPSTPVIPFGLKGFDPYPALKGNLDRIYYYYEQGLMTEEEAASKAHTHRGSSVLAEITTSTGLNDTMDWLKANGGNPLFVILNDAGGGYSEALVPVSQLGPLSQRDGVKEITQSVGFYNDTEPAPGSPDAKGKSKPGAQINPTPEPSRTSVTVWTPGIPLIKVRESRSELLTPHSGDSVYCGRTDSP